MKKVLIALLMTVASSKAVYGANLYCQGEVIQLYTTASGDLNIKSSWRNSYTRLCNLKGTANNIDPLTCSVWSSYLTAAMNTKKKVLIRYLPAAGVTCQTLATYSDAPPVSYVMLTNDDVL